MSNPLLGAFISVAAAQAGRAYIEKHGHSSFVARWGTAFFWSLMITALFMTVGGIIDGVRGSIRENLNVSDFFFAHASGFVLGLFWSTCVTHHGPQSPTPWRVKGRFIAWWATLIAGWMLLLHLMIGAAWLVGWMSDTESFLPYSTLVENRPMNSWQASSIYWCFWIAFALNIYGWRRSGKLVPEDDEAEPDQPAPTSSGSTTDPTA